MLRHTSALVSLVLLIDRLPWPPEPPKRPRGHPKTYSDRLIVKALVIMIIRRLYTAYALLAFFEQDNPLPQWRVKMPVKGLQRSQLLALGAVVIYQLVLLYHMSGSYLWAKGSSRY